MMYDIVQTETFARWERSLKDAIARAAIASRLARMAIGNFGDAHSVGDGVRELRIHVGPGYRVYYQKRDRQIVILLCGGDKSTQAKDIKLARQIAKSLDIGND